MSMIYDFFDISRKYVDAVDTRVLLQVLNCDVDLVVRTKRLRRISAAA
jgi:hypothetical protein